MQPEDSVPKARWLGTREAAVMSQLGKKVEDKK
jgi:hypothetical protein